MNKNNLIKEAGGKVLNSKNETLHEDFFERHKNHILIDSEELDEGKRKIILELGFEILNEKEISSLVITMDKEKFCNPKKPVKKKPTPVKRKPEKIESPPKKQKVLHDSDDGTEDELVTPLKIQTKKEPLKVKKELSSPDEEKEEKVKLKKIKRNSWKNLKNYLLLLALNTWEQP
jgi:hypothetical protein